jgi:hypothetical protein
MSLPRPIAVSDGQLSQIMTACEPLQPMERSAFLAALAHQLRGHCDVGDGELHRLIRSWTPPEVRAPTQHHRKNIGAAIE